MARIAKRLGYIRLDQQVFSGLCGLYVSCKYGDLLFLATFLLNDQVYRVSCTYLVNGEISYFL